MRWRDIRFEKPTAKDGDIIVTSGTGKPWIRVWGALDTVIAWVPLSELPHPDLPGPIPDGWRAVDTTVDVFDRRAKFWDGKQWRITSRKELDCGLCYIVPIDPPAPQYRPFASAAEFMPHADRWISRLHVANKKAAGAYRPVGYDDLGIWGDSGRESFREMFEEGRTFFDDGTTFGVLVSPLEAK